MSGFDENIAEKLCCSWLEPGVSPHRASIVFNEDVFWSQFTGEPNGDLRVTMNLLNTFGIYLSFENYVKYRNLDEFGVIKLQAKEIRRANRWCRVYADHRKS